MALGLFSSRAEEEAGPILADEDWKQEEYGSLDEAAKEKHGHSELSLVEAPVARFEESLWEDCRTLREGGIPHSVVVAFVNALACGVGAYLYYICLLYTSPSPRDQRGSRMPSSA